jgi:cathepsin B
MLHDECTRSAAPAQFVQHRVPPRSARPLRKHQTPLCSLLIMKSVMMLAIVAPVFSAPLDDARAERQAMVDEINNTPGITWRASMDTRFAGQPIGASASLIGARAPNADELANMGDVEEVLYNEEVDRRIGAPPTDFDARKAFPDCAKVIGDIRDQSMCGCCWAFGTAEAASDRLCIATKGKTMVPLSSQDVCFNSNPSGCNGGSPEAAWDWIKRDGIVSGKQQAFKAGTAGPDPDPFAAASTCSDFSLPHCHHHGPVGKDPFPAEGAPGCPQQKSPAGPKACDADSKLKYKSDKYTFTGSVANVGRNETYLMQEIMANGPVTVAFTVYSDFENYAGGVYVHTTGKMAGGHAVKMLGWGTDQGTDYWLIANSWNPYWGEEGYFRIKRGKEDCGIAASAVASSGDAKWVTPSAL